MFNHAPKDYTCPICVAIEGKENDDLHKNMLYKKATTPEERKPYTDKIKAVLEA